jgi:hypothetical protein
VSALLSLVTFNAVTLLVALLIGLAAGRWIFFRRPAPPPESPAEDTPPS